MVSFHSYQKKGLNLTFYHLSQHFEGPIGISYHTISLGLDQVFRKRFMFSS